MKVHSLSIENFGGVKRFEMTDLSRKDEITIVGRNGVGKSQILLAIMTAWNSFSWHDYSKYLGQYGKTLQLKVEYELSEDEVGEINKRLKIANRGFQFSGRILTNKLRYQEFGEVYSSFTDHLGNEVGDLIHASNGGSFAPLNWLSYLPADRVIRRATHQNIELRETTSKYLAETNQELVHQQFQDWYEPKSFDVAASLLTTYFADGLHTDENRRTYVFQDVSKAFHKATGKLIMKPTLSSDGTIQLMVKLPNDRTHPVSVLSSGEMMALQLLYFAATSVEHGNVLLVDEPEKHLHTSLQNALIELVRNASGAGQIWYVTHSPTIMGAAKTDELYIASRDHNGEQTLRSAGEEISPGLLEEVGISPGLWLPGNFLLIVEGEDDSRYLRQIFPTELGRAYIWVAGTKKAVKDTAEKLKTSKDSVPYVALIDRDLDNFEAREKWMDDSTNFMWSFYSVDSLFIDIDILTEVFKDTDESYSRAKMEAQLSTLADEQETRVRDLWLKQQVISAVPPKGKKNEAAGEHFDRQAKLQTERADYLRKNFDALNKTFSEEWAIRKIQMAEPKELFGKISNISDYQHKETLRDIILRKIASNHEIWPQDLHQLLEKFKRVKQESVKY